MESPSSALNGSHPYDPVGRLLPQALDDLASTDPHHVLGMAPKVIISEGFNSYTALQFSHAVDYMAHWLESQTDLSNTIAYIGTQDFRYWVMELAAIKVGHPLLLPSPRNALPNTSSLLEATNCSVVFYSRALKEQANQLKGLIAGLQVVEIPDMEEMINTPCKPYLYNKTWEQAKDDVVLVVHTSGSTGAPKPISYTNKVLAYVDNSRFNPPIPGRLSPNCDTMVPSKKPFLSSTPFFHLSGILFGVHTIYRAATSVIPSQNGAPTPEMVVEVASKVALHGMIMVPSLCDAIFSEHKEDIRPFLGSVEHICWLGGTLITLES